MPDHGDISMLGNHIPSNRVPRSHVTVRLSLLALLDQGACYGYQLRTELDWRTGGTGPINVGQIYNTLDRLQRDKLARKTGGNNYYEITETGRAEVARWFSSPSPIAELPSKLALASTLPGVDVAAIVRAQRGAIEHASGVHRPASSSELAAAILSAGSSAAARSESELLDAVEELLATGPAPTPLSTDVPKRGRPAKASA
jgi:DNA-binding PadR family transcriptional regulator